MKNRFGNWRLILKTLVAAACVTTIAGPERSLADDKPATKVANPLEGEKKTGDSKAEVMALGTWELAYDYQGNQVIDRYEIVKTDTGELTGKLLRDDKEITKLKKVRVENGVLMFEASGTTEGVDWRAELSGQIMGDSIDGTVKITANDQTFELPWAPKRVKKAK